MYDAMKNIIKIFSIALIMIAIFCSTSFASDTLTWIECVIIAQKIHPDILSAEEKLNQAKADKAISKSGMFPQITADASSSTSKVERAKISKTHAGSVSARQLLFDASKTSANVQAALENIKAAQYSLDVVRSNVRKDLRSAFVQLMRAQELVGLTEDIAGRRKQNVELVNLRYEAGREHKGSLLTAQADLAQAEYEVSQAKRQLELSQSRLSKALGETAYRPLRVVGDFSLSVKTEHKPDMFRLADGNSFLKQLIARKEAARLGIKTAKAELYPQVYGDASAGRSDAKFLPQTNRWSAGLSISLPLFEGGLQQAQVNKSRSVFKQSEYDLRSGKDSVLYTLEETWMNLKDAQETVFVQKRFLDAAIERSKIAGAQYSNGLITFNDWTIIEDNLVNSQKSYMNAQTNALTAEADWVQAKGGMLDYEE
jgi:outer membrane protein TolC